ncbi:FHA domain-containing protein, partial [Leisingera sp. JC1]|uniref:FHA domain-containing protein n=1 Tax=Leisingera sp. JC1 TaxID=1855282 RepID=UPI000ACF967B
MTLTLTLTLRLENFDLLENGGPVWITLEGHGASAGRNKSMDWVLPDATRHVSGHHFDISYRDGCYWLTDVSTNGTFLQGQPHRLQGPLQLRGGERLIAGHYVISVEAGAAAPAAQSRAEEDADPWDLG